MDKSRFGQSQFVSLIDTKSNALLSYKPTIMLSTEDF